MADAKYVLCGPTLVMEPDVVRKFADGHMERTDGREKLEYVIAEQTRCLDGTPGRLQRLCTCEDRTKAEMVQHMMNVGSEALSARAIRAHPDRKLNELEHAGARYQKAVEDGLKEDDDE